MMGVTIFDQELVERLLRETGEPNKPVHYYVGQHKIGVALIIQDSATSEATQYPLEWTTAAYISACLESHIIEHLRRKGVGNPADTLMAYKRELFQRWIAELDQAREATQ